MTTRRPAAGRRIAAGRCGGAAATAARAGAVRLVPAAVLCGAALAALVAGGCGRADDRGAIAERLRAKGSAEVVREAAAVHYAPPADGRLSEAQVRLYLAVREREIRIREAASLEAAHRQEAREAADRAAAGSEAADRTAAGSEASEPRAGAGGAGTAAGSELGEPRAGAGGSGGSGAGSGTAGAAGGGTAGAEDAGLAAADLRAAQELNVNPREYLWVRDRVQEAEAAATAVDLYQKMNAGREQLLARLRREMAAETDPARRAADARDLEDWRRGLQASEPTAPPAVRANAALLARFRPQLARLVTLEERALAASAGLDSAAAAAGSAVARPR